MNVPFLDLREQYALIAEEVNTVLLEVIKSQDFILGPQVTAFEDEIATYLGVPHAVGVASGTDALLLALKALDAKLGSEVIVPSFTFFATAGAVWNAGLRPIFCDVDSGTFNVTQQNLEAVWTERTVAVVPVHLFGQMAPMAEITRFASENGVFVLEDCAQAIGAASEVGKAGTIGDAGAFSFFPTKNLGGYGDGGLVSTNDTVLADRIRKLRVHGGKKMYHHESVGTNSRLDALQAAVLRVKLGHLDNWTSARQRNAEIYREVLGDIDGLTLPEVVEGSTHVYNQFTIKTDRRDELRETLTDRHIGTGIYYPVPLHLQECFSFLGGEEGSLPVTEALCKEVLSLPIFPELGETRVRQVGEAIRGVLDY